MSELHALDLKPVAPRPRVSLVVAWQGSPAELSRRLRMWYRSIDASVDVVVAFACQPPEQQRVERMHRGIRVIAAAPGTELCALRQLAVAAAHGDVVVIFDDAVSATASWRDHLPAALEPPASRTEREWPAYDRRVRVDDASLR